MIDVKVAEERHDGFYWEIETDTGQTLQRRWARLSMEPDEQPETYATRKAEYIGMQKRELQIEIDSVHQQVTIAPLKLADDGTRVERLAIEATALPK